MVPSYFVNGFQLHGQCHGFSTPSHQSYARMCRARPTCHSLPSSLIIKHPHYSSRVSGAITGNQLDCGFTAQSQAGHSSCLDFVQLQCVQCPVCQCCCAQSQLRSHDPFLLQPSCIKLKNNAAKRLPKTSLHTAPDCRKDTPTHAEHQYG